MHGSEERIDQLPSERKISLSSPSAVWHESWQFHDNVEHGQHPDDLGATTSAVESFLAAVCAQVRPSREVSIRVSVYSG